MPFVYNDLALHEKISHYIKQHKKNPDTCGDLYQEIETIIQSKAIDTSKQNSNAPKKSPLLFYAGRQDTPEVLANLLIKHASDVFLPFKRERALKEESESRNKKLDNITGYLVASSSSVCFFITLFTPITYLLPVLMLSIALVCIAIVSIAVYKKTLSASKIVEKDSSLDKAHTQLKNWNEENYLTKAREIIINNPSWLSDDSIFNSILAALNKISRKEALKKIDPKEESFLELCRKSNLRSSEIDTLMACYDKFPELEQYLNDNSDKKIGMLLNSYNSEMGGLLNLYKQLKETIPDLNEFIFNHPGNAERGSPDYREINLKILKDIMNEKLIPKIRTAYSAAHSAAYMKELLQLSNQQGTIRRTLPAHWRLVNEAIIDSLLDSHTQFTSVNFNDPHTDVTLSRRDQLNAMAERNQERNQEYNARFFNVATLERSKCLPKEKAFVHRLPTDVIGVITTFLLPQDQHNAATAKLHNYSNLYLRTLNKIYSHIVKITKPFSPTKSYKEECHALMKSAKDYDPSESNEQLKKGITTLAKRVGYSPPAL